MTRLGIVYRFQEGKIRVNHNLFLCYTKDESGELVIVPEEAEVIKRIYEEFLEGQSCNKIARGLMKDKMRTRSLVEVTFMFKTGVEVKELLE